MVVDVTSTPQAGVSAVRAPGTIRRLGALGVRSGWRCLEVGAGHGSIARWLAEKVGPGGSVVAAGTVEETVGAHGKRRTRVTYTLDELPDGATDVHFQLEVFEAPLSERLAAPQANSAAPQHRLT